MGGLICCGPTDEKRESSIQELRLEKPKSCKIVLVGDTGVGKTSLIKNYLQDDFKDCVEQTVLDTYKGSKKIGKE